MQRAAKLSNCLNDVKSITLDKQVVAFKKTILLSKQELFTVYVVSAQVDFVIV